MQPVGSTKLPFLFTFPAQGLTWLLLKKKKKKKKNKSLENNDAALMPWSYMEIYKACPCFNWLPATVCT